MRLKQPRFRKDSNVVFWGEMREGLIQNFGEEGQRKKAELVASPDLCNPIRKERKTNFRKLSFLFFC